MVTVRDRLSDLRVRVAKYTSRGPGLVSQGYQVFWEVVGQARVLLGPVGLSEELFELKISSAL